MGGPYTQFNGILDGNNKKITGLTITGGSYSGLIGSASNSAIIKNIDLEEVMPVKCSTYVGTLAGALNGTTIENIDIDGNTIEGMGYVGGMAGYSTIPMNNYEINNITINSYGPNDYKYYGGLFGYTTNELDEIFIKNSTINGRSTTGSIVGYTTSPVQRIDINNTNISGTEYTGGAIGQTTNSLNKVTIKDVNINATETKSYIGGIVGYQNSETSEMNTTWVENLEITGTGNYVGGLFGYTNGKIKKQLYNIINTKVQGNNYVGGLVGQLNTNGLIETVEIEEPIEVEGANYIGGLVGAANSATLNEIKFATKSTGTGKFVGGIYGSVTGGYTKNSVGSIDVHVTSGGSGIAGYMGANNATVDGLIIESGNGGSVTTYVDRATSYWSAYWMNLNNFYYFDDYIVGTYSGVLYDDAAKNISAYESAVDTKIGGDNDGTGYYFDFDENNEIHLYRLEDRPIEFNLQGSGTESDPYLIHNAEEWNEATTKAQQVGVYYKLVNDIDFSGKEFYKMGGPYTKFNGTLDGNNKKITGLTITGESYTGLFGYIGSPAIIKNLTIKDCEIKKAGTYVGLLSGYIKNGAILENIIIKDNTISGMGYTGGVTGATDGNIANVTLKNITINHYTIKDHNYIGGISGYQDNINAQTNNVSIDGITITGNATYVGGLYGYTSGKIQKQLRKYKNIEVNGNNSVGGLVGKLADSGSIETAEIESQIKVSGTGNYIGGIVGEGGTVQEIKTNTKVNGNSYVGGISGRNTTIKNVLVVTEVTGTGNYTGGIKGYTSGNIEGAILESGSSNKYTFYGNTSGTYTDCYYIEGFISNTIQGTQWPSSYINNLQQYSQAIETEHTGDTNNTGYYFGNLEDENGIHLIPSQTTNKTTPLEISYSGIDQAIRIKDTGTYKLEVWGAQGGSTKSSDIVSSVGGYGGYSVGYVDLEKGQILYVTVGSAGESTESGSTSKTVSGGFNGGANGYMRGSSGTSTGGGGGATHISFVPGLLPSLQTSTNDILIVAGGGGGGHTDTDGNGYNQKGGNAGGYIGHYATQIEGSCSSSCTLYEFPSGGTQTSGGLGVSDWSSGTVSITDYTGKFGQGATGTSSYGGGGAGFYGGGSGSYSGGGGGSSYIGNSHLTNKAMYCYECETSEDTNTKTISNTLVMDTPTPMCSKIGNGYARITYINN